ncbi:MAG: domain containing protein [Conexibacter sp.]|nr:domain containing protein [Conexibacter sp.]
MTAKHEPGDDPRPAREPGKGPLVLGPLPPAGASPANGASADPNQARADHAAKAARAQVAAALRVRGAAAAPSAGTATEAERAGAYAGLVTRTIAYIIDAAAIALVALVAGVAAALALSIFHLSNALEGAVTATLAVVSLLWTVGYFAAFWSTTGQTPGSRVMRIRVIDARGEPRLKPRRALVRVAGLVLATIPLFAGFLMMLWDGRRRCLQDRLARTVVVHAPAQVRTVRRQATPDRRAGIG